MKYYITVFFLFCFFFSGFSQNSPNTDYYLDQHGTTITKSVFDQRCKTYVLKCQKYKKDSITLFKINTRYKFGTLKKEDYQQIRKLLSLDSKLNIDDNKVIVLKFQDTIIGYKKALFNMKLHYREHHDNPSFSNKDYSKAKFSKHRKRFVKSKFKCVKKFQKKYDTKIVHVYRFGDKAKASYGELNMFKDRGLVKRLFFKNNNEHNMLVLKPSGDYFLVGGHLSDKDLGKLISDNDWTKYQEQLDISLTKKVANGFGIFERVVGYHKKHCF